MPAVLDEISGISFHDGNADTIYAEQDEEGKLFTFRLGGDQIAETKFAKKGDFEDVQVTGNRVIMLRSDGRIYTFPFSQAFDKKAEDVKESDDVLPEGEYESMYADKQGRRLYVLCKHCSENKSRLVAGHILSIGDDGGIQPVKDFALNAEDIAAKAGMKKIRFEPSALARNERTGEWFILSSVNKMVVVTSDDWTVKEVFRLDPSLYNQPEGMAFDNSGNLYISNEKGSTAASTVCKITYRK
jgi:uncharacterized protein YjiK